MRAREKNLSYLEANSSLRPRRTELVLLRRKYLDVAGPIYDTASASDEAVTLKRHLSFCLCNFEDRWEATRYWLKNNFPRIS